MRTYTQDGGDAGATRPLGGRLLLLLLLLIGASVFPLPRMYSCASSADWVVRMCIAQTQHTHITTDCVPPGTPQVHAHAARPS
jgi:hypothetical protein